MRVHFLLFALILLSIRYEVANSFQLNRFQRVHKLNTPSISRVNPRRAPLTTTEVSLTTKEDTATIKLLDIRPTLRNFFRTSWFTWWAQIILSVVSGAIITFANIVRQTTNKDYSFWFSGFALSGIGVLLAFASSIWTWNVTTICRRIWRKKVENRKIVPNLRRAAKVAVGISFLGMSITLIAAEQIVGTLFSKILASQAFSSGLVFNPAAMSSLSNAFQPIDIFLVQANTNCLLAHFVSLFSYTLLQLQLPKDEQPIQLPPTTVTLVDPIIEDIEK